jgi:hypothetical protein
MRAADGGGGGANGIAVKSNYSNTENLLLKSQLKFGRP